MANNQQPASKVLLLEMLNNSSAGSSVQSAKELICSLSSRYANSHHLSRIVITNVIFCGILLSYWITLSYQHLYYSQQLQRITQMDAKELDWATCCKETTNKDVCGRENCTGPCPLAGTTSGIQLQSMQTCGSNAFFLETTNSGMLNYRQACAVESLARLNPSLAVHLIMSGDQIQENATAILSELKSEYKNIFPILVNMDDYVAGTPLERWYFCSDWREGPFKVAHLADGLRLLTVSKFGGYYFDLDFVFLQPVTTYKNFIVAEALGSLANGAYHFDKDHPLIQLAMEEFRTNYRRDAWGFNGPELFNRILLKWCKVGNVSSMFPAGECRGISVLPPRTLYDIYFNSWHKFFEERPGVAVNSTTLVYSNWDDKVLASHVWNKMSSQKPVFKNSTALYSEMARLNCPKTFSIASNPF